ncbi:hypothetical protein EVAR_80353_1 [Eumeta japonica]|uniref:Uncharacterized protein n=1 Tax=Eumeta variegata TaxID=151549 RepID=A0A4C1X0J3_EUMVA|nr:hypothetical protein EVAR_80353_1 [Eumeta japonica]
MSTGDGGYQETSPGAPESGIYSGMGMYSSLPSIVWLEGPKSRSFVVITTLDKWVGNCNNKPYLIGFRSENFSFSIRPSAPPVEQDKNPAPDFDDDPKIVSLHVVDGPLTFSGIPVAGEPRTANLITFADRVVKL